jgi:crotonobetainyl-CoA:carnitine CoA-transferase CaiB-like acyl-CoA transferase
MAGPCNGLVVLDFSWGMAGGLATAVLADFGADVIKMEPPAGDPFRSHAAWLAWNRGTIRMLSHIERDRLCERRLPFLDPWS